jgi:hypothetical protein
MLPLAFIPALCFLGACHRTRGPVISTEQLGRLEAKLDRC